MRSAETNYCFKVSQCNDVIVAPSTKRIVTVKTLTVRMCAAVNIAIVCLQTWKAPVEALNLPQQRACTKEKGDMLTLRKMTQRDSDISCETTMARTFAYVCDVLSRLHRCCYYNIVLIKLCYSSWSCVRLHGGC